MRDTTKEVEEIVKKISNRMARGDDNERIIGSGTFLNPRDERFLREEIATLTTKHQEELERAVEAGRQEVWEQIKQQANRDETGMYMFYLADTPTKTDNE